MSGPSFPSPVRTRKARTSGSLTRSERTAWITGDLLVVSTADRRRWDVLLWVPFRTMVAVSKATHSKAVSRSHPSACRALYRDSDRGGTFPVLEQTAAAADTPSTSNSLRLRLRLSTATVAGTLRLRRSEDTDFYLLLDLSFALCLPQPVRSVDFCLAHSPLTNPRTEARSASSRPEQKLMLSRLQSCTTPHMARMHLQARPFEHHGKPLRSHLCQLAGRGRPEALDALSRLRCDVSFPNVAPARQSRQARSGESKTYSSYCRWAAIRTYIPLRGEYASPSAFGRERCFLLFRVLAGLRSGIHSVASEYYQSSLTLDVAASLCTG